MDRSDITGDRHCAAGMTGSAIQIGHHRFPDLHMRVCLRRCLVLMRVMTPMCDWRNCLVLTILTHCGRRDLQRYQHHQENKNPETHEGIVEAAARGTGYMPCVSSRAKAIACAMSGRTGMGWNALILDRPGLPIGKRPMA